MTDRVAWVVLAALLSTGCHDDNSVTAPSTVTGPTTVIYSQLIGPQASAARTFVATQSGTVSLTLQNSELPMGIAIGVPSADGNRCRAAVSVVTLPGDSPQLTTAVEAGTYCLLIFDVSAVGSRTNQLSVTVVLIHP